MLIADKSFNETQFQIHKVTHNDFITESFVAVNDIYLDYFVAVNDFHLDYLMTYPNSTPLPVYVASTKTLADNLV